MPNPLFQTLGGGRTPAMQDGGFGAMMQQMEQMLQQADNDRQRDVIRHCMDQLERI